MYGPTCAVCDKGSTKLDADGWCSPCLDEFARVMFAVRCAAQAGVCVSRFSCMQAKTCVQIRAAVTITKDEAERDRQRQLAFEDAGDTTPGRDYGETDD